MPRQCVVMTTKRRVLVPPPSVSEWGELDEVRGGGTREMATTKQRPFVPSPSVFFDGYELDEVTGVGQTDYLISRAKTRHRDCSSI